MSIVLTADQQAAYADIVTLITTPSMNELVIDGYAGTGKTTLINTFLDEWPKFVALSGGAFKDLEVHLTATTNKAADALSNATGQEAGTIHSLFGLRVKPLGYRKSTLVDNGSNGSAPNSLIVIDEASFIDDYLLKKIREKGVGRKILFLGDPCQLKPVNSDKTPVFDAGIHTAKLTTIVRQSDDSPIQKFSRALRNHVLGEPIPKAGVDGVNIFHMQQQDFQNNLVHDCATHAGNQVRALAWTNKRAIFYNELVAENLSGTPEIKIGDTVVVNRQAEKRGCYKLTTDSTIHVVGISAWAKDTNGIISRELTTDRGITICQAQDLNAVTQYIKGLYDNSDMPSAVFAENHYVDIRLMYASTVNKSQGSTYDTVYIDLNDIGACPDRDQVRRMLYVAVSRARNKVVFTGDI